MTAWGLLGTLGLLVLAHVPGPSRGRLLPAAPLLGVAVAVAVLHATTLLLPVRPWGAAGVVAVGAVLVLTATRRQGAGAWHYDRTDVAVAVLAAALGVVPLAITLAPDLEVGGGIVQPTDNHDAFFYVGLTEWLQDHDGVREPVLTADPERPRAAPPGFGSAQSALELHLRIGESLVQAAVNTVLATGPSKTWYPLTCLWAALVVGSVAAVGRLADLPPPGCLAAGLAVGVFPVTLRQAYNQNSPSLLGIALVPLALALFADALSRVPRVPRVLSALMLAALVGCYAEYLALVVPAAVVTVLARRPSRWRPTLLRAAATVGLAVALVPLAWLNAVLSSFALAAVVAGDTYSPFSGAGVVAEVSRAVGASVQAPGSAAAAPVLLGAVLAALIAGIALRLRLRVGGSLCIGVLASCALVLSTYGAAADARPYAHRRVVELGMPLLVAVAALGWAALRPRGQAGGRPGGRAGVRPLAAGVAAAVWLASSLGTDLAQLGPALDEPRKVDASFRQAAAWVRELGGPAGRDVTVVVPDFYPQLWLAAALTTEPAVGYPVLRHDYLRLYSAWDGAADPLLLVDDAALVSAEPAAVVRSNSRFRLLDLRRGAAVVAVQMPPHPDDVPDPVDGAPQDPRESDLLVLRSPSAGRRLALSLPGVARDASRWQASGPGVQRVTIDSTVTGPRLLLEASGQVVRLHLTAPPREHTGYAAVPPDGQAPLPTKVDRA